MALDWSPRIAFIVAVGGALGCVLRYTAAVLVPHDRFPWATLAVNVLGSFVIAFVMFHGMARDALGAEARFFLVTGLLGGFTTMSAFAFETLTLATGGAWWRAGAYATATFVGSLLAAFGGRQLATLLP